FGLTKGIYKLSTISDQSSYTLFQRCPYKYLPAFFKSKVDFSREFPRSTKRSRIFVMTDPSLS
ncbi:MAG TPA: hypothetical protein VGV69_01595, partial [Solirubrobacterales bacterium]|nr:hypothetical protein [Solirubrobacterales bacterium]